MVCNAIPTTNITTNRRMETFYRQVVLNAISIEKVSILS